jgi:diacylglycerol kinase (ATP)
MKTETQIPAVKEIHAPVFSVRDRLKSFEYAFAGIKIFLVREHNARIHFGATILVITLMILFRIQGTKAVLLILVTGLVWITEILNTCVENILDHISPARHPTVKYIKDISAGAVLIAAITAILTGAFIFIPEML